MYSQINYLGCFLSFPEGFITSIDGAITNFVKGKLNLAKKRLYKSVKEGGLGLFEIPNFLHAQRCAWIKRSLSLDEQWKVQLYVNNYGNILNCKSANTNRETNPILYTISLSYEYMYERFVQKDENFRSAYIVGTKTMTRDLETKNYITHNFFGRDFFSGRAHSICGLKYSDFYTNQDVMIPAETVIAATGIPLTVLMIQTLRGVCGVARTKYSKKELSERVCVDVRTFMLRGKKGSKRFRMLMAIGGCTDVPHNISKFARNMDIIINGSQSAFLNSLWTNNYFNNNMKTFLFKFHNNTLGYNNAVAHFVRRHSPECTFCDAARDVNVNPETGLHLFF
jgi:hypothetical protein